MLAFPNAQGPSFQLTPDLLSEGFSASRLSLRRRIILPIHRSQDAPVQRMLNFFQPGTYVHPHLHPLPGHSETVHVLHGRIGFILFDPSGTVTGTFELEAGPLGLIDIEPNIWHGMVCLQADSVILETKCGPYDGTRDKTFAPWAPTESDPDAPAFRKSLEALFPPRPA